MLWRHGDVMIAAVPSIPAQGRKRPGVVLAHAEVRRALGAWPAAQDGS